MGAALAAYEAEQSKPQPTDDETWACYTKLVEHSTGMDQLLGQTWSLPRGYYKNAIDDLREAAAIISRLLRERDEARAALEASLSRWEHDIRRAHSEEEKG